HEPRAGLRNRICALLGSPYAVQRFPDKLPGVIALRIGVAGQRSAPAAVNPMQPAEAARLLISEYGFAVRTVALVEQRIAELRIHYRTVSFQRDVTELLVPSRRRPGRLVNMRVRVNLVDDIVPLDPEIGRASCRE